MLKPAHINNAAVHGAFLTREGGVSGGVYATLNCGPGSADDAEHVRENRRLAVSEAGLGDAPLVTCAQVHSPQVVRVSAPWTPDQAPQADALVTDRGGLALGVLTADCAPVLFADADAGVVGAAHAGWRGAVAGVLEATVAEMEALGAHVGAIQAAVGPCIHQDSYEVGGELYGEVLHVSPWAGERFRPSSRAGHFLFDLPGYVEGRLTRLNLGDVQVLKHDTYTDAARFFSYRRTTHQGGGDYGRQLSVIGLGA